MSLVSECLFPLLGKTGYQQKARADTCGGGSSGGPRGLPLPSLLLMGKKKKKNLRQKKSWQGKRQKNRPPPLLAQGLDPPLTWWRARGCLRNVKTLVRSRRPPVSWYWIYREYIDWKIFQKCALDVRWQRHVTNVVSNKCEKNYWFVRFSLFWYYSGSLLNLFSRKKIFESD